MGEEEPLVLALMSPDRRGVAVVQDADLSRLTRQRSTLSEVDELVVDEARVAVLGVTLKEAHLGLEARLALLCAVRGEVDDREGVGLGRALTQVERAERLRQLQALYERALRIKSAIPHPRIIGLIRECGGKMHMAERNWNAAATDFFESFKNYDEAGQPRRVRSLKYLVLANMLMESNVNPFDAQEARPFRTDPEVVAITSLVAAYQRNDIERFEALLELNRKQIMEDAFVRDYVEDLLKNIRTQVLMRVIKPYTRVGIPFIAGELKIPEKDVEALLVSLILDARIRARIDQLNNVVEIQRDPTEAAAADVYKGLEGWAIAIQAQLGALFGQI